MIENATSFLWTHPALWPAVLFAIVAPIHFARANRDRHSAQFTRREASVLVIGGALCLSLYIYSVFSYVFANTFLDLWESLTGSIASVFLRGGRVYPDFQTEERYASPYGPFLYLAIALSHLIFGATAFSTKLPCALATFVALALFWVIVRRQSGSRGIAFAFTGLEAALMLAFRVQAFWPKPDGLILLAVSAGLVCALRCGIAWQILFGFALGAAVDLKPHAAAYFLPLFVLAHHRGWQPRAFAAAACVAILTSALPFLAHEQFSFPNYLRLLRLTMEEGFSVADALTFLKWVGLLAALMLVGDHWHRHATINGDPSAQRFRFWYRCALALGLALVAVPGAAVGAGPRHVIPFVPIILYDLSLRFSAGAVRNCGPDRPIWRLVAYSALSSCLMIAAQTAVQLSQRGALTKHPGALGRAEIMHTLDAHRDATILMGAGSDEHLPVALLRHEIVFAGNPIGIDLASAMDYRRAGIAEPNLAKLTTELHRRHRRRLVWLVPHGEPFSISSLYDAQPVFSDRFRRAFHDSFALREASNFFDVYVERDNAAALAGDASEVD